MLTQFNESVDIHNGTWRSQRTCDCDLSHGEQELDKNTLLMVPICCHDYPLCWAQLHKLINQSTLYNILRTSKLLITDINYLTRMLKLPRFNFKTEPFFFFSSWKVVLIINPVFTSGHKLTTKTRQDVLAHLPALSSTMSSHFSSFTWIIHSSRDKELCKRSST